MKDYDNHRCEGSLKAHCSIRRCAYPKLWMRAFMRCDGQWHLYQRRYDYEYDCTYMSEVAAIKHCPWCGKEL